MTMNGNVFILIYWKYTSITTHEILINKLFVRSLFIDSTFTYYRSIKCMGMGRGRDTREIFSKERALIGFLD